MTTILLTGRDGQLGGELRACATVAGHTVRATGHGELDITDATAIEQVLDETAPDVVINCAAWTNVDAAEADAQAAFEVNAVGPRLLSSACGRRGVLILQMSTDYVFAGDATAPIDERQLPKPISVYGATKLAGEESVRALAPRHLIVRTSWLYGRDGPNFVLTMLRARARKQPLRVVSDQVGSPTWTGHLSPALLRLIERDIPGTYHLSNAGAVSWHGFAQAIFAATGTPTEVTPIPTTDYPTAAARPRYTVLDNRAWRMLGEQPLPPWLDGLGAYLAGVGDRGRVAERKVDPPSV